MNFGITKKQKYHQKQFIYWYIKTRLQMGYEQRKNYYQKKLNNLTKRS